MKSAPGINEWSVGIQIDQLIYGKSRHRNPFWAFDGPYSDLFFYFLPRVIDLETHLMILLQQW